jgi:hypothetical protein
LVVVTGTGAVLPELGTAAAMLTVDCAYFVVSATLRAVITALVDVVINGAV